MKKLSKIKRIGVLYGGWSQERDISIKTGVSVIKALREENFNVVPIDVDRNVVSKIKTSKIDFAFIALHGPYGEDGTIQGLLEIVGIPYSGSGVLASALSMNKIYSKRIFESNNIPTPKWCVISDFSLPTSHFPLPAVVKPSKQGSAIGVSIVRKKSEIKPAIRKALKFDDRVILEEYIEGKEVTVAILGEKSLPPIEIVPKHNFYDFYSKYAQGGSEHLIPPRLNKKIIEKAQKTGLAAHMALGCKAVSRVDMIVDKKNNIYVLEVNSIPGMTETSLLPDAARADGLSFNEVVLKIIEYSLK